jgi:hypothetical protein
LFAFADQNSPICKALFLCAANARFKEAYINPDRCMGPVAI